MRFKEFFKTWDGIVRENRIFRILTLGLVASNILTAMAVMYAERTVVLVPPNLTGEAEVNRDSASLQFTEAWALFVADILGNVKPETSDFVFQNLARLLSSDIYNEVKDGLTQQVEEIKRERVSLSFYPKEVTFEPETGKTFVTGNFRITGVGGEVKVDKIRTYEMRIDISGYKPIIRHVDAYEGSPKTLATLGNAGQNK